MLDNEKIHIEKAKKGNKAAFGALYDHYLPQFYRFLFLKVSSRAEAEDLTHEVFLSAWKNLPNYKYEGFPFSSWLYQIAKNAAIDFYRTAKKSVPLELMDEELIKMAVQTPETAVNDLLELERIKKCLRLLKPDYQDVLIMRFIEEMSHEEIAITLTKSQGAVRLIQHRALKELKSIYENDLKNYGNLTKEA